MRGFKILFQGSYKPNNIKANANKHLNYATAIAEELAKTLICEGFSLILTGYEGFDEIVGKAAEKACNIVDPENWTRC